MTLHSKEILYYLFVRLPKSIFGKHITRNLVRVHWGRGLNNFGDCLQPDILRHYGLLPVYVPSYKKSDILLMGSILQNVPEDYSGVILGTGGDDMEYHFPKAAVLGVRGHLTKNNFTQLTNGLLIGDTGVLAKVVYPEKIEVKYKLGIVPHFVDLKNNAINEIKRKYPDSVKIISPLQRPKEVVKQIKSCGCILSSSLHGLIIADSFGIPNRRWVDRTTMNNPRFHDYKFHDYYTSISYVENPILITGLEAVEELIAQTTLKPYESIAQQIDRYDDMMKKFAKIIIGRQR